MDRKLVEKYRELMVEIKYRIEVIDSVLEKKIPVRVKIAEELCYLQLRFICELIALSCLTLHKEIAKGNTGNLIKSYKADFIMNKLDELNPKFYPQPLEHKDNRSGEFPEWVHLKSNYLTKNELKELYNKICGAALHRGTVKNIFKSEKEPKFNEIKTYRDKVINLLNKHIITSPDEKEILYILMKNQDGLVSSTIFEAINK